MTTHSAPTEAMYAHLASVLRGRVANMKPGERVSSEPELSREFNVSRFTVARAVELLVRDGLVVRRQGSGTFVADQIMRQMPSVLFGFAEAVKAAGQHSSQRLRTFTRTEWAQGYPYAADTGLYLLDRLRLVNGRKIAWHRSVLSENIVRETGLTDAVLATPDFSLYRHLAHHGHCAETAQESFAARLASADEVLLLDLPDPAAVISVRRTTYDAGGAVIDFVEALYDARSYSYRADLVRGSSVLN
jgi:GntR family transcriptional regulator